MWNLPNWKTVNQRGRIKKMTKPYFTEDELGSFDHYDSKFLAELCQLRHTVARPFIITSGARTKEYNARIGGAKKSLHIWDYPQRKGQKLCMAVDIKILDPAFKVEVVKIGLLTGWSIGLNFKKRFIHLDRRVDLGEEQTIFGY